MESAKRVVTQTPLLEVWDERGIISENRLRDLVIDDILALLRAGEAQFVVAEAGLPLSWVAPDECYRFWKTEVKTHLAASSSRNYLDDFPDEYCYLASEWESPLGRPLIVLEKLH